MPTPFSDIWSETCSGLAKYVNTVSTGAFMSIDFLTTVNDWDSFQWGFKALHDFQPYFDLQYIDRETIIFYE